MSILNNSPAFNASVNAWAVKHATGLSMGIIVRKLALDALVGLTYYTPVDTGYCRFNWQVSITNPKKGKKGKKGAEYEHMKGHIDQGAVAEEIPPKGTIPKFGVVYVQNNVEYAQHLNDGTSKTEAHKMIERTHADLPQELATTVEVI